jgi:hypothetical protein
MEWFYFLFGLLAGSTVAVCGLCLLVMAGRQDREALEAHEALAAHKPPQPHSPWQSQQMAVPMREVGVPREVLTPSPSDLSELR